MISSPRARGAAVAVLAAVAGWLPGAAPAQGGCGASYTVQPGDTLAGIAERCRTTVMALIGANAQVEDPARISVGWELTVPGARASLGPESEFRPPARGEDEEAALAQGIYEVRPGDSFASIATALQIPMRALMAANEGVDPFGLRAGQSLRLPAAAEGQATASERNAAAETTAPEHTNGDAEQVATAEPGRTASDGGEARSGQKPAAERLMLEGRVESGAECPVLETPGGEVYSLVSAEYGFMPGEYVEIEGEPIEMSFCMAGTATIRVTSMNAVPAPQGG